MISCGKLLAGLILISFVSLSFCASVSSSQPALPGKEEQLILNADTTITIASGQTAMLSGSLKVQGMDGSSPNVTIINMGLLTIDGQVSCSRGKLNVVSHGNVTLRNAQILCQQNAVINILNIGNLEIKNSKFHTSGQNAVFGIDNSGSMNYEQTELLTDNQGVFNINGNFGSQTFEACKIMINKNTDDPTSSAFNMINGYSLWGTCEITKWWLV